MRAPLVALMLALPAAAIDAQDPQAAPASPAARRSQRAEVMQMVAGTEIRAMYIRPVARGRTLFGTLVPYGRIWTPSADSAMRLTFSTDVTIQGSPLKAGAYSVWAIPDSTQWTIIFNSSASVFHLRHREADDVLRVTAKVDSLPHVETLTLSFPVVDGKKAMLQLQWGTRMVSLAIDTP